MDIPRTQGSNLTPMTTATPNTIIVTLRMDSQHDVRAVRLLLKRLLRAYDLKCVSIQPASAEVQP